MQTHLPIQYVARVVLEAATPLSISTGSPDGVFDTALVTDANGLPALPGSTLAGVLRALWKEGHQARENVMFGHQNGSEGQRSAVDVSWGVLLDSHGKAVQGLLLGDAGKQRLADPLLASARDLGELPCVRQRVRLGSKGAAADTGKFDRAVLPAGFRFAFEIRWRTATADDATWQSLLNLLAHPALRLGGGTRSGLGRLQVVSVHQGRFDRTDPVQAKAWCSLGQGLDAATGLAPFEPALTVADWLVGTLRLTPCGPWRIGQGDRIIKPTPDKPADLLQVTEARVRWSGGRAQFDPEQPEVLVPASSLKGVLAHRFVFHAHRFAGRWAEADDLVTESPEQVALFGEANDSCGGQAGCLLLDDSWLSPDEVKPKQVMHNSIDRFTGGVRDRVLYSEESLWEGELHVPVLLDRKRLQRQGDATAVRQALRETLRDLCAGRLPLGSRTSTGNGYLTGRVEGPLAEWLEMTNKEQAA